MIDSSGFLLPCYLLPGKGNNFFDNDDFFLGSHFKIFLSFNDPF